MKVMEEFDVGKADALKGSLIKFEGNQPSLVFAEFRVIRMNDRFALGDLHRIRLIPHSKGDCSIDIERISITHCK